ncbi:MAG: DUF1540 domain-containing protein [Clostridia bacterium]|nr:DUF1540 domain-containing protein [Clostridia bacterium]
MPNPKSGKQTIKCHVLSCKHNSDCGCDLGSISVEPCSSCHSGKAEDESLCGSYECRNC